MRPDSASPDSAQWCKALWCEQPYPDNHTSDTFLEALVVNDGTRRSYWRVVYAALSVDQQLCAAAAVASVAYHLHMATLDARHVLAAEAFTLVTGSLLCSCETRSRFGQRSREHRSRSWAQPLLAAAEGPPSLSSTLLLLGTTAALSPVYATLTASISPDTIVACACALLLTHLYLHDYSGNPAHLESGLANSLGLACALCASVLMASQLRSLEQVFSLMVLSLEVYVLVPILQRHFAHSRLASHVLLPAAFTAGALALLALQSALLTSALLCALAFVTVLCPMWLVRIHKFKAQINGPWDEAAPKLSKKLGAPS